MLESAVCTFNLFLSFIQVPSVGGNPEKEDQLLRPNLELLR